MAKTYSLSISGDSGARYRGSCTVTLASGSETVALEGAVPLARRFEGEGLSCTFEGVGRIAVQIEHGGGTSRSETSGGTARVRAR